MFRLLTTILALLATIGLAPKAQAFSLADYDPPGGTRGWCTPVGPGQSECFGSPAAACEAQWQVYGAPFQPNAGPLKGFKDTSSWSAKECDWDYFASPAPTIVLFECDALVSPVAPGRCVSGWNNFQQCVDPCSNFGSRPSPATPGPIDIYSGSKIFEATDFENENASLAIRRTFGSLSYSGSPASMLRPQRAAANWRFQFSVELQLTSQLGNGRVSVLLPDGSLLGFEKQTDGSLQPYTTDAYPVPRTDYVLALSGTWPTNLADLRTSSSTWILTGPQTTWTLSTKVDPVLGQYLVGTPDTMVERQGGSWAFDYGAAGELESLTDQFGNEVTFEWNINDAGTSHPTAVSEIGLPGGRRIRYSYEDSEGGDIEPERLTTVEWLSPTSVVEDRTRYIYDDDRYPLWVTEIQDADDVGRRFVEYQEDGKAASSSAALGAESFSVTYASASGSHTRVVTGPLGRQTTYTWSAGGYPYNANLQTIVQAASANAPASTESYTSSDFETTSMTDAEGRVTSFVRDSVGRPTTVSEAAGTPLERQTTITWDPDFNVPTQVARPGLTADLTYDAAGRLTTRTLTDTTNIVVPYATNGRTRSWTYDWSVTGLLLAIDGPLAGDGDKVSFTYDSLGNLSSVTNEVGHVTQVTAVDWRGAPSTIEDENGVETILAYDIRGRPTSVTVNPGPDQSTYAMAYDAVGNLSRLTLPGGGWLEYQYDAASRLIGMENDRGETQAFSVNAVGQPLSQTIRDPSSAITLQQAQAYDELGRVMEISGAASQTWSFQYDKIDNLVEMTDPRTQTWSTTWDALNRIQREIDPETVETEFSYDDSDALIAFEDGRDLETTRIIDGFGLTIRETSPDRGERTYWYDEAARLVRMVDGDSVESLFVYDDAGRLLSETFTGSPSDAVTYAYDSTTGGNKGIGRLTGATDPAGVVSWIYDEQGRVIREDREIGAQTYTMAYAFDANGDVTSVTYPSGRVVEFERDPDGDVTAVDTRTSAPVPATPLLTNVRNMPFGPVASLAYANGLELTQSYDQNYWQIGLEVAGPSTGLLGLEYSRDSAGALDGVNDQLASGRSAAFGYTPASRLQYAVGAWGDHSFSYDAAGNRTEVRRDAGGVVSYEFAITPPESNRIEEVRDDSWTIIRDLTWRLGGSLYEQAFSGGDTQTFYYDARGRVVQLEVNGVTAANYAYDFDGKRVAAAVGGSVVHYVMDDSGRLLAEHDGATGAVLREYVWLEERPVAVVVTSGGVASTYYIHTGQIGEPLQVTDAAGVVVWNGLVDPWGQVTMLTPPALDIDFRLLGQWRQPESGLHQNWMRDYDPTLGRYVQADPLGLDAGPNLYAYVGGDPLSYTDPTGEIVPLLVGAAVGAGADLGLQLLMNGGRFDCVNWGSVAFSGALGLIPGAGGSRLLVRRAGTEWSHALPGRLFRPSSRSYQPNLPRWIESSGLNGSWTSPRRHYMHDTFRWPRGWRGFGERLPEWARYADRVPDWMKASVGGGIGVAAATPSGNCCR